MHICLYISVWVWVYAQMCTDCKDQKRAVDALEMELQVVESYKMWILGAETGPLLEKLTLATAKQYL